ADALAVALTHAFKIGEGVKEIV
ncbi:MAG: hypothetical protein UW47_C0015G0001, partial [Candidatus Woesebacteria bacterium GW2011_GWA1_44_23]